MIYNPWYGWGFGVGFGFDWFDADFGLGWWGPDSYYPCFWGARWGYAPPSFYGREPRFESRMQLHARNNLYRDRPGVWNRVQRPLAGSRPTGIVADRTGNVFERNSRGQWLSHSPAVRPEEPALDRMQHFQDRGAVRSANFQRMQHFSAPHFGGFHGGGRR